MKEILERANVGRSSSNVAPLQLPSQLPTDLFATYVAATFVLLLNWWVDNDVRLTPVEVDDRFRSLVLPILLDPSGL